MRQRPESSVSPDMDEYGELCFPQAQAHGPVIHRTPEELGLSRVCGEGEVKPSWYARDEISPLMKVRVALSMQPRVVSAKPKTQVIGGEEVRLPAGAVMGAEMIDPFARKVEQESKQEGEDETMRGQRPSDEVKRQICAEPETLTGAALEQKYGVTAESCKAIRKKAGLATAKGKFGPSRRPPGGWTAPAKAGMPKASATYAQAVHRGHDLLKPPVCAEAEMVKIELVFTREEYSDLLSRLSVAQFSAVVSGGIKELLKSYA